MSVLRLMNFVNDGYLIQELVRKYRREENIPALCQIKTY